jgi:hypothetical protein
MREVVRRRIPARSGKIVMRRAIVIEKAEVNYSA